MKCQAHLGNNECNDGGFEYATWFLHHGNHLMGSTYPFCVGIWYRPGKSGQPHKLQHHHTDSCMKSFLDTDSLGGVNREYIVYSLNFLTGTHLWHDASR